ncbi:hypothetical protein ACFL27_24305 [candidate division CSSED10-310 bacterium]|uniref:GNAT family N-acetyltransferase n=1 Tax=candidate division CSSED10-310 bacterium TaxID=2855610 RepID=A0ABV6Z4R0_UNCC1
MNYRVYDPAKDKAAALRIWQETGWVKSDNTKSMDFLVDTGRTIVVDVGGEPECLVVSLLGDIDYAGRKLSFSLIAATTTSLLARQQNIASYLTAEKIALDAHAGAAVCGLGMFDQGYYDRLGFGSGSYEHIIHFTPSTLKIAEKPRTPRRLTCEDWSLVHQSRIKRLRVHGSCILSHEATRNEMYSATDGFGFGYLDRAGELTHHFWLRGKGREQGPLNINWFVYRNYDQLLELLALLKSFGDQIKLVTMIEPPHIQFQDFLSKPFHHRAISHKSTFQNTIYATAFWQMRICNLEKCLAITSLSGETVRFNLTLEDPITSFLCHNSPWQGISGDYIITLGSSSTAEKGSFPDLPVMKASVGAFTRMWLGVCSATSLAVSDELSAPGSLLDKLDALIRLPVPRPDWDF